MSGDHHAAPGASSREEQNYSTGQAHRQLAQRASTPSTSWWRFSPSGRHPRGEGVLELGRT